jgi:competence protein ComEC
MAALRRTGVRRLAVVALTHAQSDHAGGLAAVLRRYPVGLLLHPPLTAGSPEARAVLDEARRRGVPVREIGAGDRVSAGAWRLRVLWPARRPSPTADPNAVALVALASAGAFDALLTADAESGVLGPLPLRPVEVLKVAHHGSADPGLAALLRRLRPAEALISVGENGYGHPAASTLAALGAAGAAVHRTDREGDVTVVGASAGDATMGRP